MFKTLFKKYKSKSVPSGLDDVLEINENSEGIKVTACQNIDEPLCEVESVGLTPPSQWKIFQITSQPGLIIVKNPFTWQGQRYWIKKCLEEYPVHPNRTNLDIHRLLSPGENWWKLCQIDNCKKEVLYKKLRWITLGYHHNWETKEYSEQAKSQIPPELRKLCQICARSIGDWKFLAQAAIINFYHFGSTLSGHTDHSEPNNEAPILSFSFGARAIFLIEDTHGNDCTALLVESGDLVVMSGQSRLAMHGVPKILPPKQPFSWDSSCDETITDLDEWNLFNDFVISARINMNLRQVLYPGQSVLL